MDRGHRTLVSIGTAEATEDFQLHGVEDATRLADGRIVVANGGSWELLVFDGAGNYLTAWGGEGEGPGEFSDLNRVRPWATDSLIADDPEQGRISAFDLEGNHGWTVSLRSRSELADRRERGSGHKGNDGAPDEPRCCNRYPAR